MKISINGELILQNPIYIDIINLLSRSGYRVHITCDIQHSDQVKEILKEKKCVYEDIKFYNFENKYKILSKWFTYHYIKNEIKNANDLF